MKKLDFNQPLKDASGKQTSELMKDVLKDFLATETEGNAVKMYGWVTKLNEDGVLELDKADTKTLSDTLTNSKRMYVFVKGQLLNVID